MGLIQTGTFTSPSPPLTQLTPRCCHTLQPYQGYIAVKRTVVLHAKKLPEWYLGSSWLHLCTMLAVAIDHTCPVSRVWMLRLMSGGTSTLSFWPSFENLVKSCTTLASWMSLSSMAFQAQQTAREVRPLWLEGGRAATQEICPEVLLQI